MRHLFSGAQKFKPVGVSIFASFLRGQVNSGKNDPKKGIFAGKNDLKNEKI